MDTAVVIIGGGPVGLCLAVELGRRGIGCTVLERRERAAPTFPTANHIGVRTMEHLRRLGLADDVRAAFRPDWGGHWIALTHFGGHEVARVENALAGAGGGTASPESEVWAPKPCFDPILERAAEACSCVTLRYGARVETVENVDGGVRCTARDAAGTVSSVHADYAVACDGAGSAVRGACEIPLVGPPPLPFEIPSAFFRSRRLAEILPDGGVQYALLGTPDGPTPTPFGAGVMVAVDGYDLWRLHGPGLDASSEATTLARLQELGAADAEILRMTAWTPRQGLSTTFRHGRIFLAGDAAHVVTPFGGLGVNTGMADAFDLGWKIEATLRGWGGPRLLDSSYDFERRAAAIDLLRYQGLDVSGDEPVVLHPPMPLYDAPTETLWRDGPEGETARRAYGEGLVASRGDEYVKPQIDLGYRYDGSPIIADDGSPPPDRSNRRHYEQSAKPGGRAPHVPLPGGRSTLDLFGRGFVLLAQPGSETASAFERAASQCGLPLRIEPAPAASAYDTPWTLVRPDGFVGARGTETVHDPSVLLDHVRGAAT